jgi:hypothetical protein
MQNIQTTRSTILERETEGRILRAVKRMCGAMQARYLTFNFHFMIRNAYESLVGKSEGDEPLRRSRRRWENNIKKNFK